MLEAALNSSVIDDVIVSTDSKEIADISKNYGVEVPFMRPKELATDESKSIDVILHALDYYKNFDYVILLQPTSPLRTSLNIDEAFNQMVDKKLPSCVSLTLTKSNPYLIFSLSNDEKISSITIHKNKHNRRQDFPDFFKLNGAIYISEINWLKKNKTFITNDTFGYIMDPIQSHDIDTLDDFLQAEKIITDL